MSDQSRGADDVLEPHREFYLPKAILPFNRKKILKLGSVAFRCRLRRSRACLYGGLGASLAPAIVLVIIMLGWGIGMTTMAWLAPAFTKIEKALLIGAGLALATCGAVLLFVLVTDRIPPLIAVNLDTQTITCADGEFSLIDPPVQYFLLVEGRTSRKLLQFVLVRSDDNGAFQGRALLTFSGVPDLAEAIRHVAAFLPAPLFVISLGPLSTPSEGVERMDDSESPVYWQALACDSDIPNRSDDIVEALPLCMKCGHTFENCASHRSCPQCGFAFRP